MSCRGAIDQNKLPKAEVAAREAGERDYMRALSLGRGLTRRPYLTPMQRCEQDIAALERQIRQCDRFQADADTVMAELRARGAVNLSDWEQRHAQTTKDRQTARAVAVAELARQRAELARMMAGDAEQRSAAE